jgi:uncharacterized protein YndB with AHSA1/START domain
MTNDTATKDVEIERTIDAPIELVWRMWTDPDHFKEWYGPDGATVHIERMDVRVGGTRHFAMEMATPGGIREMWFIGEYLEVEEPNRLVYSEAMSDGSGSILSATTEVTVELKSVGESTRIVMTHAGVPADSPGAQGWNVALDKLATRAETQS